MILFQILEYLNSSTLRGSCIKQNLSVSLIRYKKIANGKILEELVSDYFYNTTCTEADQ